MLYEGQWPPLVSRPGWFAVVRARHDQLADAVVAGTVSVATLVRADPTILAEITKLEAHEKELSTPAHCEA